jgi:DNA-binding GntR family transcriptional regulator
VISADDILLLEDILAVQKRLLECNRFEELLIKDNAFHEKLFQICGAEKTFHAVSGLCGQYNIIRALSLYNYTTKKAVREHFKILDAIKNGNKTKAREIMTEHITRHSKEYSLIEKNFPRYFLPAHANGKSV